MPKYRITSPDGKTYDITAPDGASQQQVLEFAQAQFGKSKAPQQSFDPTEGMGTGERLLAGVGKGMHDLYLGGKQALGLASQAEVDERKRLDAPLMNTTAGTVGNVAGKVAAGLPAAFIPGANTVAGAAVIGATQGALEPTATGESTLGNMALGATGGAGGVLAGRAIKAGVQGGRALLEPFTAAGQNRIAGRVLDRFASDPAAVRAATSAPTATGAMPTLAESARDTGIAALERSLGQQDPQIAARFLQRGADNNAARVGMLQQMAGTEAERAAAEAARKGATEGAYRAGTQATYTLDPELADLLGRPAVRQAMERAKTMAANQGRQFAFDVAAPTGGEGARKAGSRQITGQGLQDLKMALDEMLSDPASGFTGKAGDTIKNLRGQLLSWMEKANPEFKTAREGYAAASKPINAMDVGQRLLDRTTGAIRDMGGNPRLQANAFSRALNDEQSLVRNATGFRGVNALEDVLTPQQIGGLNALRGELELGSNLASAANGPGSQTARSLASQNLLRQVLGPTGLPQSWAESALLESLLRPVQFGMKAAEPRIQNRLADILLDPSQARAAMDAAAPQQLSPALQRLLPYLQQAGQQSVPAALVSR